MSEQSLLQIENLTVDFGAFGERQRVVHDVSFNIAPGEKLAIVGESGSGKSVTALSILRLHDDSQVHYGNSRIRFQGEDLLSVGEERLRDIRGGAVSMVFQEPMTSLNPVYTIGDQLTETLMLHQGLSKEAAQDRVVELLDRTGIKEPRQRLGAFPHMLSGGQRQRVMIAMALACNPKLLIADEPTTALDVTVQAQILDLLDELQREFNMAVLLITHDLNIVRRFADRICVMQKGRLVEEAGVKELFSAPQHDYTKHLLDSTPQRLVSDSDVATNAPSLISGQDVRCYFPIKAGFFRKQVGEVRAVDAVNIHVRSGETVGLVGESGSGKTTLGMCLLRLQQCQGDIRYDGRDLMQLNHRHLRPLRREFQVVFQDPYSSLSPRMSVEDIVGEGLRVHHPELSKEQRRERIIKILEEVGLERDMLWRFPHEFSGGQRQRIAIARAVVLEPRLILLDEPTSALDVSVQKQVLELLHGLQKRHNISYLFITHDLKVIRAMAHRILVVKNGCVVEQGDTEHLFQAPQHDYTRKLLHASLLTQ